MDVNVPDHAPDEAAHDLLTKEKSYMFEERLDTAGKLKELGNEQFKQGKMDDAAAAYERALYHVDFDELQVNFDFNDKHRASLVSAKLPILLNMCQCLLKSGGVAGRGANAGRATDYAGQAIELDSDCAKAWFLRGKAKMNAGDLEGSAADLTKAAELAPNDKSVRLAAQSLKMKRKELATARKGLWGGILKAARAAPPAPGRKHVEEAAARARGEAEAAGTSDRRGKPEGAGSWLWWLGALGGIVAFAVAGVWTARYQQKLP